MKILNTPVVRIVDKPHLNADGTLRKNTLAKSLLPAGKLGKLIFTPPDSVKTIVIDELSLMRSNYLLKVAPIKRLRQRQQSSLRIGSID